MPRKKLELSNSGRYYIYRNKKTGVTEYYTLEARERVPLASGQCRLCQDIIESKCCGDFQFCKCGKSFVDTDRWMPERHRYGGEIMPIDQISPTT